MSLTLYTRSECPLCQEMEAELMRLSGELQFTVRRIDLLDHPECEARFGEWVPVLMAGERELCHYHLDEKALRDWLMRTAAG